MNINNNCPLEIYNDMKGEDYANVNAWMFTQNGWEWAGGNA